MSPPPHTIDDSAMPEAMDGSPVIQGSAAACHDQESSDMLEDSSASISLDEEDADAVDKFAGESGGMTLLSLPPELLLNIMSYLDARVVIKRLSLVCKQLHRLISNDATWKIRVSKRWPKQYPVIPVEDEKFNWQLACIEREEQYRFWSRSSDMEHFTLNTGHIGGIDTVHLMEDGDLCISGSRDRSFHLWDLRMLDARDPEKSVEASKIKSVDGHKGWVWHITSKDNIFCTSSWDMWMKLWDINADCAQTQGFRGNSAFLCSVLHQWELHAGAYDKQVYVFDRRDRNQVSTTKLRMHKMPVLCLASDDDYIISGSEDKTIAVFDRRAGRAFKRIELEKFPMCMSYGHGQLWVGRKDGLINVIDPTHGRFDVVQTYDVGHSNKVTGILHSLGSVITCSTDCTVKIHEPNRNPSTIRTIDHMASISAIHTNNGVLATGGSDLCVDIWRPSHDVDDSSDSGSQE